MKNKLIKFLLMFIFQMKNHIYMYNENLLHTKSANMETLAYGKKFNKQFNLLLL